MINTIEKPKINKNALNYIYLLANAIDKNNVLNQVELKPLDQKSFYDKAMVIDSDPYSKKSLTRCSHIMLVAGIM